MSRLTNTQKVANHFKAFTQSSTGHLRGDSYKIGKAFISKNAEGLIELLIDGERVMIYETGCNESYDDMMPISAIAVKHLNAIKDVMNWEFKLLWIARKPYAIDGRGEPVSLPKTAYSRQELAGIAYS